MGVIIKASGNSPYSVKVYDKETGQVIDGIRHIKIDISLDDVITATMEVIVDELDLENCDSEIIKVNPLCEVCKDQIVEKTALGDEYKSYEKVKK